MTIAGREIGRLGRAGAFGADGRGRLRLAFALMLAGSMILFWAGLAHFVVTMPTHSEPAPAADGVVALTGGADRIADAAELLAAGRARRMLISGVNQSTSSGEIARLTPNLGELLKCCVDLDHAALNTAGNAAETARWARAHGLRSVIVVTSDYHMPRALVEMRRALPEARLTPHAVPTPRLRSAGVFADPDMMRIVVWEYLKYIRAIVRSFIPAGPDGGARMASRT